MIRPYSQGPLNSRKQPRDLGGADMLTLEADDDYTKHPALGGVQPFEHTGGLDEMLAAHDSCYLYADLNPANNFGIKGKDACPFLSENFVNGTKKLDCGQWTRAATATSTSPPSHGTRD